MSLDLTGKGVSKYRPIIRSELERIKCPLPVELVEAIIKIESGGVPGLVNPKSGATGLGQVMPVVVSEYNKTFGTNYSMSDLRGKDEISIRAQISICVWVLSQFWKSAYNYLFSRLPQVPIDELIKISDLFYVAGPGATKKKLSSLPTPTFDSLRNKYPKWNAFRHVDRLIKRLPNETDWQLSSISNWLHGKGLVDRLKRDPKIAGAIATIALMLASKYFFR